MAVTRQYHLEIQMEIWKEVITTNNFTSVNPGSQCWLAALNMANE